MIKVVCFFKKKEGMSSEAFRDYYENHHLKLFERLKRPDLGLYMERHIRRYLTPFPDPISGIQRDSGCDVILEIWYKDKAFFEAFAQGPADPEFRKLVAADEEMFLDRDHLYFHTVEECDLEIPEPFPQT